MHQKRKFFKIPHLLWHILFWIGCYLIYVFFFGIIYGEFRNEIISNLYLMPIRIAATYFLAFYLMPRFLYRKRYVLFVVLMFPYAFLFGFAIWTIHHFTLYCEGCLIDVTYPLFYLPNILDRIVTNIEIPAVFALVIIVNKWYTNLQTTRQLEKDKLEAELKFLKSQIHPHFLFNTLNNLYALTLKKSDKAPDMVLRLSEMLDYILYNSNEKEVPLKEEVRLVKAYLELEKIRYGDRLQLKTTIQGDPEKKHIAPLLLLPFVENSFKHGASSKINPHVELFMNINENFLQLEISNTFEENTQENFSEGIGLKNVQRRLEIQYKDQYELNISKQNGVFQVVFKLFWNHNS